VLALLVVYISAIELTLDRDNLKDLTKYSNKNMSTTTLITGSVLAAFCGFLTHQILETLINTTLVFIPFNIHTTSNH
jgi:hypothetical protein